VEEPASEGGVAQPPFDVHFAFAFASARVGRTLLSDALDVDPAFALLLILTGKGTASAVPKKAHRNQSGFSR
jgi:hypothetical protein